MTTAFLLICLGTMARLAPLPHNAKAIGALALYAGAKLPRTWAFFVPIAAMFVSDLWIDWGTGQPAFTFVRGTVYVTFAVCVGLGMLLKRPSRPLGRFGLGVGLSLASSTLFFLTTNLAVWLSPMIATTDHPAFPATFAGLRDCYVGALPFYRNGLLGDLAGMAIVFGIDWAVAQVREAAKASRERTSLLVEWAE